MSISDNKQNDSKVPNEIWTLCGSKTKKDAVVCIGQYLIMVLTLAFCASMLIIADGQCEKSSPYIGLISFVLGKALASVIVPV